MKEQDRLRIFDALSMGLPQTTPIGDVRNAVVSVVAIVADARFHELSDIGVEVRRVFDFLTKDRVEGEDPRVAKGAISRLVQRIQSGNFAKEE